MTIRIAARSWTGLAIRRALADPGLVAVSALVVVVAAAVMIATAVHPAASASRSAIRALQAADPGAASVVVTRDVAPAEADAADGKVRAVFADALGPIAGSVVASGRSESFGLAGASGSATPLLLFGYIDGVADRTRLVAGAWPTSGAGTATSDLPVVLSAAAAERLKVQVGSRLAVQSRIDAKRLFTVAIVGILEITDRSDPAWAADPLALDGSTSVGPFTTVGPLFVDRATLLARTVSGRASLTWVAVPSFGALPAGSLPSLAASTASIPDRLNAALGRTPAISVTTQLPTLLRDAGSALERAGSGSTALAGPLVAISLFALVLVASLMADRRRGATTLLRARGAGARALAALALVEAAMLAVVASLAGVPLGILVVLALGGAEGWGAGLLPPTVSGWQLAGITAGTAILATLALLVPTLGADGPLARLRRFARRRPGSMAATRSGLDIALLALAALLVWQLRSGGAAATTAGRGLGPLDMAAPAVALLAGAVVSLRVTSWLAALAGSLGARSRSAAPAIAGRSLARRADAHARVALLVVAATATALLCASLGRSWTTAQRDQAAHTVAADVAGQVHTVVGASRAGAGATYLAIPGVTRASGVIGATFDGGRGLRSGRLLAVPADPPLAAGALRSDLADRPAAEVLAGLAAARPAMPLIALPDGTASLRVAVGAALHQAGSTRDATSFAHLAVAVVVMAPDGTLTRTDAVPLGDAGAAEVPLPGPAASLVAVEVEVTPSGAGVAGSLRVTAVSASGASGAAVSSALDLAGITGRWSFVRTSFGLAAQPVATAPGSPDTATFADSAPLAGPGATVVAYRPSALDSLASTPLPALADATFLAGVEPAPDGSRAVRFNLADTRRFAALGTVTSFPGIDGAGFVVVDLGAWQLTGYGATGTVSSPTAWWIATDGTNDAAVAKAVTTGAYRLEDVRSLAAEVSARLDNPIADAVLGSLAAVGGGALLVTALGVLAAASQARRARRGEVAVFRAQGLDGRGLAGWLLAEEAFAVIVGVAGGLILGSVIAALVVPALVHALDGVPAVPSVLVLSAPDVALAISAGAAVLVSLLAISRLRAALALGLAGVLRSDAPGAEPG